MEQTAVKFLEKKLKDFPHIKHSKLFKELFEQAKEMEKKQIINSFNQGYTQCSVEDLPQKSRERFEDAEDYIKKTFK